VPEGPESKVVAGLQALLQSQLAPDPTFMNDPGTKAVVLGPQDEVVADTSLICITSIYQRKQAEEEITEALNKVNFILDAVHSPYRLPID
jgi:hypothetical protein